MERKNLLELIGSILIVFFLLVGVFLYSIKSPLFKQTTPILLLIFGIVVFLLSKNKLSLITIPILFFVEVLGVATTFPFGTYSYSNLLGPSIFAVPLIIGLNWYVAAVTAKQLAYKIKKLPEWAYALITGLLVMILDIFIEPVAIGLNWWMWPNGVGIENYISWFVLGALSSFLIKKEKSNVLSVLFISQLIFFIFMVIII